MTEKTRQEEITECVTILAEAFRQRVSEITFRTYEIGLSDLDINVIKRAVVVKAIRDCKFMPSVHELRELCGATNSSIAAKDRPLAAWQAVREAIRKVGAYESPCFDDPVIHAVIQQLGGWPVVCETLTSEMKWLEKDFCKTYSALCNAELGDDLTGRLHGLCEISNAREGYLNEPIHVAHVRCLTGTGSDEELVTRRLQQSARPQTQEPKGGDVSVEQLSISLSLDKSDVPGDAETKPCQPTVLPEPAKSKSQQIAELKHIANQSADQLEAG